MYCYFCGKENKDEQNFCKYCGKSLLPELKSDNSNTACDGEDIPEYKTKSKAETRIVPEIVDKRESDQHISVTKSNKTTTNLLIVVMILLALLLSVLVFGLIIYIKSGVENPLDIIKDTKKTENMLENERNTDNATNDDISNETVIEEKQLQETQQRLTDYSEYDAFENEIDSSGNLISVTPDTPGSKDKRKAWDELEISGEYYTLSPEEKKKADHDAGKIYPDWYYELSSSEQKDYNERVSETESKFKKGNIPLEYEGEYDAYGNEIGSEGDVSYDVDGNIVKAFDY